MKTFKTLNGQIGCFSLDELQTFEDHYVVGDCVYPFDVLGTHTIENYVDPVVPPEVPQSVTMRQARLALLQAGKLSAVDAAIAGMAGVEGDSARIEWDYSNEVQRAQPLVAALGGVLGMTSEQLDQLFITAATL